MGVTSAPRRLRRVVLALATAVAVTGTVALTGAPSYADVTIVSPGGALPSGRTPEITLSTNEIAPGERVQITGRNFDAIGIQAS